MITLLRLLISNKPLDAERWIITNFYPKTKVSDIERSIILANRGGVPPLGKNNNIWTSLIGWSHLVCILQSPQETAIMMTYGKPWFCEWALIWSDSLDLGSVLCKCGIHPHLENGCEDSTYYVYRHTVNPGGLSAPPMAFCVHNHLQVG